VLIVKFDEAYSRSDAVAIADLFTPDAVQVWEWESAGGVASGQQAIEKRYEAQFATSPRKLVRKRRVDCFGLAAIRSATDRNWSVVTRRPESSAPVTFGITWRSSVGVWSLRAGFFSRSISSRVITGCGVLASFSIGSEACQAAFHRRRLGPRSVRSAIRKAKELARRIGSQPAHESSAQRTNRIPLANEQRAANRTGPLAFRFHHSSPPGLVEF
jgi:hypothetical protein